MNNGSWLPGDDLRGLSDNFFDDFISHIDFPLEDIETTNDEDDWNDDFQKLVPPSLDVLSNLSSEFTRGYICKRHRVGGEKTIPIFKQSKSSGVSTLPDVKVSRLFQSSSPVSVLDNANGSVSSQNLNRAQILTFPVKGIRSKRNRPTLLRFSFLKSLASVISQQFALKDSVSESYLSSNKKKRKRIKHHSEHSESDNPEPFNADGTIRKCSHCETTKTPQWREGPNGPKTLCNACGVRYRSGRLLPEYRPASSPTFVPTKHSNSHRKIIEMRRKGDRRNDPFPSRA